MNFAKCNHVIQRPCAQAAGSRRGTTILAVVGCLLLELSHMNVALPQDVVHLEADETGGRTATIHGEIVDLTGRWLSIRRPNGTVQRYDATRVHHLETNWQESYDAGRELLAAGDHAAAIDRLFEANRQEQRVWARRLILEDLLRAYVLAGNAEQAGDIFVALVQSDPTSPAYEFAPLAWFPNQRVAPAKAAAWLQNDSTPGAMLLGASHLLATAERPAAEQALATLLTAEDPRVAGLAESQLWRSKVVQATEPDVLRWAQRTATMPAEIRAGAHFVVALGWQQVGRPEEAVLQYLRLPILYPQQAELASRALFSAARLSHQSGFRDEAIPMLQEVLNEYADMPEKQLAEKLLQQLADESG